jgi:hypothetical protein
MNCVAEPDDLCSDPDPDLKMNFCVNFLLKIVFANYVPKTIFMN